MKTTRKIALCSIKIPNKRLPYVRGGTLIIDNDKYTLKCFGVLHIFYKKNTKFERLENCSIVFCNVKIYDNEESYELIMTPNALEKLEKCVEIQ